MWTQLWYSIMWIINLEHSSLLNDRTCNAATFWKALIDSYLLGSAPRVVPCSGSGWWADLQCAHRFPFVQRWQTFWCLSKLVLKSTAALWVLTESCLCQSWPVICCHCSRISKRQLSERGQEGLWFFFFPSCLNWQIQREKGACGQLQSWQLQVWERKWLEASDRMLVIVLVVPYSSVVCSRLMLQGLQITALVLYSVWILEHLHKPPVCFLLFSVSLQQALMGR